jgi:hypothetical protein
MRISGCLFVLFLCLGLPAVSAAKDDGVKWKCGDWTKSSDPKKDECRTCTRTICDAGDKVTNCRKETKTECTLASGSGKATIQSPRTQSPGKIYNPPSGSSGPGGIKRGTSSQEKMLR